MRSSLGFAAANMLGIEGNEVKSIGKHVNPPTFIMSKQQENQNNFGDKFYDDTGRGLQALKV